MSSPGVAIVSTVKAPVGVLRSWISHHLDSGIDRIILFLDDPEDGTRESLDSIGPVHAVSCTDEYWANNGGSRPGAVIARQVANLGRGMALAAQMGCGWVAHVDCDELIRPLAPLAGLLSVIRADGVKMTVLEAVSENDDYASIFDASLFKLQPSRPKAIAARALGCRRAFQFGEFFRGHTESKMLVRTDGSVTRMGVHKPIEMKAGFRLVESAEIQLLHFDCIGFTDWDKKWSMRLQRPASDLRMRPARLRQFEAYKRVAGEDRETRMEQYRKLQMIPRWEAAILKRLGLLTRIQRERSA